MTSYVLQRLPLNGGLFEFTLWSEFTDLTVPTFASLAIHEGTKERADTTPLTYEIEQLSLDYTESYDYYQEGFWFKVLSGECEIQITCDNEHYFWGRVDSPISDIQETSLVANYIEREGTFSINSVLVKAKTILTTDILLDLAPAGGRTIEVASTVPGNPGGTNALLCQIKVIIASILSRTFSQTYDTADVVSGSSIQSDFITTIGGIDYYPQDLYVYGGRRVSGGGAYTRQGFLLQSNNEYSFDYMFYYAYDLLWALCKSMGVYPKHYYNTSTSRHQIMLVSRSTYVGFANTYIAATNSNMMITAYPVIKGVAGARITSSNRNQEQYITNGVTFTGVAPSHVQIDLSVDWLFVYDDAEETFDASVAWLWLYKYSGGTVGRATLFEYYKYDGTGFTTGTPVFLTYWYHRYAHAKRGFSRTYPTMLATDSNGTETQVANKIFATHSINDGVSSRTYFAAEMFKMPEADETQITWIEV